MTSDEMLKIAYAHGVNAALEDANLVKEAIIGRALGWLGKTLVERPLSWAGKGIAKGVGKATGSPTTTQRMLQFGKGGTRGAALGGTLMGGLNAASAPEGERGKAFVQGFIPGAIGFGPGWQLGSRAGQVAAQRGLWAATGTGAKGAKAFSGAVSRSKNPIFTQRRLSNLAPWNWGKNALPRKTGTPLMREAFKDPRSAAKTLGSKALLGGIPFGTAMAGSMAAEAPVSALLGTPDDRIIETPMAAAIYHTGRQAMGQYGLTSQAQSRPSNYGYYGQYQ